MDLKKILLFSGILFAVILVGLIGYSFYSAYKADKAFFDTEYHGKIENMALSDKGYPSIFINNKWRILGINEEKIRYYITSGDSLVKVGGSKTIIVYRKDESNEWTPRIFK